MGCGFVGDETEGMVQSVVGVRERAVVDDKKKRGGCSRAITAFRATIT